MSLLLKVLGGALAGIGEGMVQQAKLDWEEQKADLLYQRQVALANLEHSQAKERIALGGEETRKNTSHTAKEQRVTNVQEGQIRGALAVADDQRDYAKQVALKGLDYKNDVKLKKLAAQLDLTLEDFRAKVNSGEVTSIQEDANGNYFAVMRSGQTRDLGKTAPVESDVDPIAARAGRPQGQQRTQAADEPDAVFRTRYTNATPETAPRLFRNGVKIPFDEAYQLYRGQ